MSTLNTIAIADRLGVVSALTSLIGAASNPALGVADSRVIDGIQHVTDWIVTELDSIVETVHPPDLAERAQFHDRKAAKEMERAKELRSQHA